MIARTVRQEEALHPDVEFSAAILYGTLGIPVQLLTALLAAARVVGWTAHVIEQHADNAMIRPTTDYTGEIRRAYVPMAARRHDETAR